MLKKMWELLSEPGIDSKHTEDITFPEILKILKILNEYF